MDRRDFLKLMAASLALAGTGCVTIPREHILPYAKTPEELVPGIPRYFATAMEVSGYATGLLVESHEGRPTKIEGNPSHSASLGATDAWAQASILTLYDPERARAVTSGGQERSWPEFLDALRPLVAAQTRDRGAGLRILTGAVGAPTLRRQLDDLMRQFPNARWIEYEPLAADNSRAGSELAFGQPLDTLYHFDRADRILSLDGDFLESPRGSVPYTHDFAAARRVWNASPRDARMSRMYAFESVAGLTGVAADHRWAVRAHEVEPIARAIASRLGLAVDVPSNIPALQPSQWLDVIVADLEDGGAGSLVVAGERQPAAVHALAHALNDRLGSVGRTVDYLAATPRPVGTSFEILQQLVHEMQAGQVQILLVLEANPAYDAPADIDFASALRNVPFSAQLSLYEDETAALTSWHIPQAHYLETWSDARAFDGTASIVQPLIEPLYGGKSTHEMIAAVSGERRAPYDLVRDQWRGALTGSDFESIWRQALQSGTLPMPAPPSPRPQLRPIASWLSPYRPPEAAGSLDVIFQRDPNLYDGRFAPNGWLQELPRPLTKLTWDNAALLSPATASRLHVQDGEVIELRYRGNVVQAPALAVAGHPDDSVTLPLGSGRTRAGTGSNVGFDAYRLRTSAAPWFDTGLEVRATGKHSSLATTSSHHRIEGRNIVHDGVLASFNQNPNVTADPQSPPPETLYPAHPYPDHAWGMTIDLTACIGCNACIVACQAENNIPIVGKEQVLAGREMHWLRVDLYRDAPATSDPTFQPVPCMQCEDAPCEVVCPVNATVHSDEGLNDMVYNRCVGTRYCSNNCPYKVRHFNFLEFADFETESLKAMRNPNVTVRSRGVMEKCTYCVQRINAGRIAAERERRPIRDGEIRTACQAVCPAQAITFGDLHDPASEVSRMHASPLDYAMLAELNTHPRTTYLAMLRNPHPALKG